MSKNIIYTYGYLNEKIKSLENCLQRKNFENQTQQKMLQEKIVENETRQKILDNLMENSRIEKIAFENLRNNYYALCHELNNEKTKTKQGKI